MAKPLIFDPATGELITDIREISRDKRRSSQTETDVRKSASTLEDRLIGIFCDGGEGEKLDALRLVDSAKDRDWSAKIVASVVYQIANGESLRGEALKVAKRLGFQAAVVPVVAMILREGDRPAKLAAVSLAESYGAQGTVLADFILPLVESSDKELAEGASHAIGSTGLTPSSIRQLAELVRHREARIRRLCVETLGILGARAGAVSGLVVLRLDDPDKEVRTAARDALAHIGFQSSALDEIERMLNHDNVARRIEMLDILGRFGSSAQESSTLIVPLLKCADSDVCNAARNALSYVGLSKECIRPIGYLARHPSHEVRLMALELLEECGAGPEAANLAIILMADRDVSLRERSSSVVAKFGVPAMALPALRKLLRDERVGVRLLALSMLEKAGASARNAARLVIERMEDADSEVAAKAAAALSAMGDVSDCLPDVSRILHNRRQDRRLLMLSALSKMRHGALAALPLVTAAMGDSDWLVRDAAAECFVSIGFDEICIPEIRRLIKHQDRNYRLIVIKALGACGLGARAAANFLAQRESDSDAEVGHAAKAALDAVTREMA
jgi:HEAT repeat protein